jgi:putative selenium metabolism hydrolase
LTRQLELEWITSQELYQFTQRLIQTPSLSTREGDVAALVVEQLNTLGFPDVRVNAMGSVIATLGSGRGPILLYDAHMDTVSPAAPEHWLHPPHAGVIDNGTLYGLGAIDMKGALASMIYGARQLLPYQDRMNGTLVLAFVVQEEPCEGLAIRVVVEEDGIRPDWVLLGEPTNLQISRGQRGRVMFKVTVEGRASHGSQPHLGQNAVYAAARLVFAVQLLAGELPNDTFLGPGTIAVTGIESQSASLNAIPDRCKMYIDRRLTLGETVMGAQAQLESLISREAIPASVQITTYDEPSYTGLVRVAREAHPAWVLDRTHPLVSALNHHYPPCAAARGGSVTGRSRRMACIRWGEPGFRRWAFGPGDPRSRPIPARNMCVSRIWGRHVYAGLKPSLTDGRPNYA